MAKSDLLKEAIADAKAVKETALANAKIALEEAFAPRIQSMLSTKLAEDEMYEEDLEDEEMFGNQGELEPLTAGYAEDEGMEQPDAFDAGEDPAAVDDLAAAMGGAEGGDEFEAEAEISAGPSTVTIDGVDYAPTGGGEGGGEEFDAESEVVTDAGAEAEYGEETFEESDDLELESIIRELEEDITDAENDAYQDLTTEASKYGKGKDDIPTADRGELNPDSAEAEGVADYEKTDESIDEGDFNIDEIIESILAEDDDESEAERADVTNMNTNKAKNQLKKQMNLFKKLIRQLNPLRHTINEVNLLNAKLL